MKRGKILLIIVPAAMAVGVIIGLVFLSSINDKDETVSSGAVDSSGSAAISFWSGYMDEDAPSLGTSTPAPVVSPPAPEPVSEAPAADPTPTGNLPTPAGFSQAPTVSVNGNTVSVTFYTTENSTVNSILVTSGEEISVGAFYDYYNRGAEYAPAVEKKSTFKADAEGVTETYTIPDDTKSYWLLINTVNNETGEWQSTVTAVPIYTP